MSWLATCNQLSCLPWGIGTGWSTSLPNYHPRDIIANLQRQWRSLAFLLSSLEHTSSCHQISRAGIFDANLCRSLAKPFREREDLKSMTTQQKHTNTIAGSRLLQEMCPWYAGFKGSLVLFLAQLLFWKNPKYFNEVGVSIPIELEIAWVILQKHLHCKQSGNWILVPCRSDAVKAALL